MSRVLLLTDQGLTFDTTPYTVTPFNGGSLHVPKEAEVDVGTILGHLDSWREAFGDVISFPEVLPIHIFAVQNPSAIGVMGEPGADAVLWHLWEPWQRNVWHLTHEVCEAHLKRLCNPPPVGLSRDSPNCVRSLCSPNFHRATPYKRPRIIMELTSRHLTFSSHGATQTWPT